MRGDCVKRRFKFLTSEGGACGKVGSESIKLKTSRKPLPSLSARNLTAISLDN